MNKTELIEEFQRIFGDSKDTRVFFAPGRVNLIGEHTDYNGGHVFPCALSLGTYAVARKRQDNKLRFYSVNNTRTGIVESTLEDMKPKEEKLWTAYPKGVIWALGERGIKIPCGFDMLIYGNIPNGSGLSSSASLEVLTGFVLSSLYDLKISKKDLALIGQYSENNYNGCNCGIMDQFASAMGKKDNAIFLDTATLEFDYAPIKLQGCKIVVTNSNVKHSLVNSEYNTRRRECSEALEELQHSLDIDTLGDMSNDTFDRNEAKIKNPICRKRAKHAVYENTRTLRAMEALKMGDLDAFGKYMNESHISLRDDYEVSCPEIDVLVESAWSVKGVIGSRITGGGFGGCTVSIVRDEAIEDFKKVLTEDYKKKCNLTCDFYVVEIGDGPSEL